MCGIVGSIGPLSRDAGLERVARMSSALAHRGPDDSGHFARDGFAFGMRRLSIIDLATGHQPMFTSDGVGLVMNGEIYNYRALRKELEQQGCRFQTTSDTEVLLQLYQRHGIDAVRRLEGMFAFAIHDPRDARGAVLHLGRDRLGKKPLYFYERGGEFLFASEIKAILAVLERRPELDRQAVHDYLTLRFVPTHETIWQGVHKLAPAHTLSFDLASRSWTTRRYWDLDFHSEPLDPDRDYVAQFRDLFLAAVEKRLVAADVPVGILLSGGLDSSAVGAAAHELGHRDLHTFSVEFAEGGRYSEFSYARAMARHAGTHHHEVTIDQPQFLGWLDEFTYSTDEPLADLASIPLYFVSRLARQHVKVVLSGEGSDEILAGYDMEELARRLERLRRIARSVPRPLLRAAGALAPGSTGETLRCLAAGWSHYARERATFISRTFSEDEKAQLWSGRAAPRSTDALIRSWYERARSPQPSDQVQEVYCREWLVEDLLMKADKMTMATSLELRCPFLDHGLVEWAARLPLEWKVGSARVGWRSKRILREFARGRLPDAVIERPKQGFPVPAYEWLAQGLAPWARERLLGPGARIGELLDPSPLAGILDHAAAGERAAAHKVWAALILDTWLRRWL